MSAAARTSNLRLAHRTFVSRVQLRQAKGTLARPLADASTITGAGSEPPAGPSSLLRTASFNGVTCTVVPIIALTGDIVLQAANAPEPELVPLYCLESLPLAAWNGRPIVPLHPNDGEQYISANDPATLDKWGFGLTFNAALISKALQLDGYLNPVRATAVGPLAQDVFARLAVDEMVEVSVGVSVLVSDTEGKLVNPDGSTTTYAAVWEQLLYVDHVAMLPAGVEGACNVKQGGCGAPRVSTDGNNNVTISGGGSNMAVANTVAQTIDPGTGEIFYGNMRDKLRAALYDLLTAQTAAQVPAPGETTASLEEDAEELYIWVVDWSNKSVIYEKGPAYQRFKRSYSLDAAGKIVLADDEVEVTTEQVYKPASGLAGLMGKIKSVIAQAVFGGEGRDTLRSLAGARHSAKDQMMIQTIHDHTLELGAGCTTEDAKIEGESNDYAMKPMEAPASTSAPSEAPAAPCSCKGGPTVAMTKDEKTALVTKILASPGSTFKEDQRGVLEATDEAVLQALANGTAAAKTEVAQATPAAASAQQPVVLTPEQWWAQAPPEMADVRTLANRAKEAEKAEKDTLVRALSTAQEAFTEDQLKAMDLTGLKSLASLTGLFLPRYDYTGAMGSLARDAASSTEAKETQVYLNPPRPFDQMRAAKSGKASTGNVNPAATSNSATTGAN
jgi:hypothetical protein